MLAVLTEINCLDYLYERGIFPDEYFTDFELFKNRCTGYKDATIVIITAGLCRFSRRKTVELIKSQVKRANNEKDTGVNRVFVISDTVIPNLDEYYKFQDNLDIFSQYRGDRIRKNNIDVWSIVDDYQTEGKHDTVIFLDPADKNDTNELREVCKNKKSFEDDLIRLIKRPDVKSIILSSN